MRKARQLRDNAEYHVIARCDHGDFMLQAGENKQLFLDVLQRAKKKYKFQVLNFCIMGNHVHMIIKPAKNEILSRIMQWILSVFAIHFNLRYKIKGHVWYDRFKSIIINNIKQLIDTFHYICNNPVKAKLVQQAQNYPYNGITFAINNDYRIIERPPDELLAPYMV